MPTARSLVISIPDSMDQTCLLKLLGLNLLGYKRAIVVYDTWVFPYKAGPIEALELASKWAVETGRHGLQDESNLRLAFHLGQNFSLDQLKSRIQNQRY